MQFQELAGRVVIVTGASRGIGRAIARAFAEQGCRLAVAARSKDELHALAGEIIGSGGECLVVPTDLAKAEQIARMVEKAAGHFGRVDILVNNAGLLILKYVVDTTLDEWDQVLAVNLRAAFVASKAVLPYMIEQKSGQIINIASIAGKRSGIMHGSYSAAKFGVLGFTEALASEVKEHGIRVNAINPNLVDTDLFGEMARDDRSTWSEPNEIADVALLLACDLAREITGTSIDVLGRRV